MSNDNDEKATKPAAPVAPVEQPSETDYTHTIHNIFAEELRRFKHVASPCYSMAEYVTSIACSLCYRQFSEQGVDFVIYAVNFDKPSMLDTVSLSLCLLPRADVEAMPETAEPTTEQGLTASLLKKAKKCILFIHVNYPKSTVRLDYLCRPSTGEATAITKKELQLRPDMPANALRVLMNEVLGDFVTALANVK